MLVPNIFIEVAFKVNVLPVTVLDTLVPKVCCAFNVLLEAAPAPVMLAYVTFEKVAVYPPDSGLVPSNVCVWGAINVDSPVTYWITFVPTVKVGITVVDLGNVTNLYFIVCNSLGKASNTGIFSIASP